MNKVYEWAIDTKHIFGGFSIFTYQMAFGISLRYWECIKTPALRIYFGPFKLWMYWRKRKYATKG